jgi:hypothetical protein
MRDRPFVEAMPVVGHLDPEDAAARLAHRRRQAVDRRHDVPRRGYDRMPDRFIHKCVLQIDHDERGARRLEIGKTVFAATACDDPLYDLVGNGGAVEFHRTPPC